jgi:hypothetical protein
MAYSTSNPAIMMLDAFGQPSGAGGAPRIFAYSSTHNSTDILATGFFTGCGDGSRLGSIGMRPGDIVINRASTSASIPGRVTAHSVIASTANVASTSASSGWAAAYDCSVASAT